MPLHFPHFDAHFVRSDWTLPRVLEHQAERRPDDVFLCWGHDGPQWSFDELNRQVNRLAHGFSARGVHKGDHVAIFLPNCPEFVLAWFALGKIGAVELALSDAYKAEFLLHPLRLSGAKWIITDRTLAARVAECAGSLRELQHVVFVGHEEVPSTLREAMHSFTLHTFDALEQPCDDNPGVEVSPDDPAAVLMTSGTTGPSKGVVMRHSQLYFFAEEDVQLTRLTADDTYMTGFPLFHGNAQFLTVYPSLIAGARCVLYPRFSASKWSERAHLCGATVTNLLGATMSFIMDAPPAPHDNAHSVRCIYAAPLATDLAEDFTQRFGVSDFVDGFGQTEISNVFMTPPDTPRPAGACGALVDQWFEIRLVDPDTGEDVAEGEAGELWVRPKATGIVAYEYLGMPEKTVEAWRDLWFHTGDAMKRDAEGWYYFVDRIKDALRRRGENISSFEVERAVLSYPRIAQCAVVGVRADEKAGEDEVLAYVVLDGPGALDYDDLIDHCERRLPNFMVPRYVEVLASLPLTATEKVRKKDLRARGIGADTWDRNVHQGNRKAG
jgi:crotonobetaine/carnitine-CoA ligase